MKKILFCFAVAIALRLALEALTAQTVEVAAFPRAQWTPLGSDMDAVTAAIRDNETVRSAWLDKTHQQILVLDLTPVAHDDLPHRHVPVGRRKKTSEEKERMMD